MKSIFEHIDNIINLKIPYTIIEGEEFSPYILQRWISMISPEICNFINETSNSQYSVISDKQKFHDYLLSVIPKIGRKKIQYIKKEKQNSLEQNKEDIIKEYAKRLEISYRELKSILELDPNFLSNRFNNKQIEIYKKSN